MRLFLVLLTITTAVFAQYRVGKPDLMSKFPVEVDFTGDNIYNDNAIGQIKYDTVNAGEKAIFQLRVQNDAEYQGMKDNITVKGTKEDSGWTVRYFDAHTGGQDITVNVTGTGWSTGLLSTGAYQNIRVEVTPPADASIGTTFIVEINGKSNNEPNKTDLNKEFTTVGGLAVDESVHAGRFFLETSAKASSDPEITYGITKESAVRLVVYDALGRQLRTIEQGRLKAGTYSVKWNGLDNNGNALPAGVYFVRLASDSSSATARLVLVR